MGGLAGGGGQQGEAKIKVEVTGAQDAKGLLSGVADTIKAVATQAKDAAEGPFKEMWHAFKEGKEAGHSFEGVLKALKVGMTSYVGVLTVAVAAYQLYRHAAVEAAEKTVELYKEVRQLQATAGGTIEEVQGLQNAFRLMGVDTHTLTIAMFRLGAAIESNALSLRRLGVATKDEAGNTREPIAVFQELRNKLSQMNSEAERSTALRETLGRQGARLAPVFKLNAEAFGEYVRRGKEMAAIDEELAAKSIKMLESEGELELQQKKFNALFGELVGMPIKHWWDEMRSGVLGYVNAFFDYPKEVKEAQKLAAELEEKAKKLGVAGGGVMSPEKMKEAEAQQRHLSEMNKLRIKEAGEQAAEEAKIATSYASAATEERIKMNEAILAEESENYEARIGILRKFFAKLTDEEFVKQKEVQKLTQDHEKKLLELESASNKERRKLAQETAKEAEQIGERALKQEERINGAKMKMIEETEAVALANLDKDQNAADVAVETERIKEEAVRKGAETRTATVDAEIALWSRLAAEYQGNAEIQIKAQEKINEASLKRLDIERDTNRKIIADRQAVVEAMKKQETEKAGIGATLEDKAVASLKKQGISQITSATVKAEATRLMAWGEYYAKQYDLGQSLTAEQLQFAKEYQGAAGGLRKSGLSTGSGTSTAISLAEQSRGAAYGFRVSPEEMVYKSGAAVTDVAKVMGEIPNQVKKALDDVGKLITGTQVGGQSLANTIADMIVRKLEFEAARQ